MLTDIDLDEMFAYPRSTYPDAEHVQMFVEDARLMLAQAREANKLRAEVEKVRAEYLALMHDAWNVRGTLADTQDQLAKAHQQIERQQQYLVAWQPIVDAADGVKQLLDKYSAAIEAMQPVVTAAIGHVRTHYPMGRSSVSRWPIEGAVRDFRAWLAAPDRPSVAAQLLGMAVARATTVDGETKIETVVVGGEEGTK